VVEKAFIILEAIEHTDGSVALSVTSEGIDYPAIPYNKILLVQGEVFYYCDRAYRCTGYVHGNLRIIEGKPVAEIKSEWLESTYYDI